MYLLCICLYLANKVLLLLLLLLLHGEVRALEQLSEEASVLRQEIVQLRQLKVDIDDVHKDVSKLPSDFGDFPPLPSLRAFAASGTLSATIEDGAAIAVLSAFLFFIRTDTSLTRPIFSR